MTVLGNWWDLNPRDTQFKMGAKLQRGISSVDQMANQQSSGRRFFHAGKKGAITNKLKGESRFIMNTAEKSRYFKELALNLQHEGFTAGPEENGLLPVELEGRRLCHAVESGGVRYRKDDVAGDSRSAALDRVTAIVEATAEYMGQMETAPQLTASGLEGDYRLLADFNNTVLAGHPTRYGVQFITWARVQNQTALHQGHYYGPSGGVGSYTAAKRNFATRSGLIPHSALFEPEQLTEIYRSVHETLDSAYPITDERQKYLQSVAEQIERVIPDLEERVSISNQRELELSATNIPEQDGMQFC